MVHDLVRRFSPGEVETHVVFLEYLGQTGSGLAEYAKLHLAAPTSKLSMIQPVALASLLREIRPDVLHTHSGVWLKAARAGRAARVPVLIHTDHGRGVPDPFLHRLLDSLASRLTDTVVAVSESVAVSLRSRVVPRQVQIVVIPNGVDTEAFRPRGGTADLRAELGIPPGTPVIGSIGRLEPVKNYGLAIRALAALIRRWEASDLPQPMLVLAGDGRERPVLESLTKELGVEQQVRFLGWREDVHCLLDTFDLFTLTSRSEGTSMSLLEAMSSGLGCVVSDVGGNRTVLGEELASALVPPGDMDALVRAWQRDLSATDHRVRLGRLARERVIQSFSLRQMADRYLALYHQLLALRSNPGLAAG